MQAEIESLDQEGRGVSHVDGKTIFIEGALPGELVGYSTYRKKNNYELAQVTEILRTSSSRETPRCTYFGICGGCSMQHISPPMQVAAKQRVLEDNLARIGKTRPDLVLPPIYGPTWEYRHRARLSVRYVEKKGGVLVGFHEKRSTFVAEMNSCEVLPPAISNMIVPLRELIVRMTIRDQLSQIELAIGEDVTILVLRILAEPSDADKTLLRKFADDHGIQFWLQPKGPDTAYPFHPVDSAALMYRLPEYDIEMPFRPTDFTQVNAAINRVLVNRALRLLDPKPQERIGDFFCGIGNFTLPIARHAAAVVGVEGSDTLVARAHMNALHNDLQETTSFLSSDLFKATPEFLATLGRLDAWLIDPPRDGAVELVKAIEPENAPGRIVYVSCSPGTLARDTEVLTQTKGYRLDAAGVMNMFPHTSHVESIALFTLEK